MQAYLIDQASMAGLRASRAKKKRSLMQKYVKIQYEGDDEFALQESF